MRTYQTPEEMYPPLKMPVLMDCDDYTGPDSMADIESQEMEDEE
jgi:hypothetical protein